MIMIHIVIMVINMRITMMKINKMMRQMIMIINSFPVLGASQGVNDTFVSPYFAPKPRQGISIYHKRNTSQPNVGKCTIHGSYGI